MAMVNMIGSGWFGLNMVGMGLVESGYIKLRNEVQIL